MADLNQIFRPSKANAPKPYLSQRKANKYKQEIQYIPPPKNDYFDIEKSITKDIKRNISRYSMEQQYYCYQFIRKRETITKVAAFNIFLLIGLFAGFYSLYKWLHMAIISLSIVLLIHGHFSLFKIVRTIEGKYSLRFNEDYTLAQNSSSYQFMKLVFLIVANIAGMSLFSEIRNTFLQYFDERIALAISNKILMTFSMFHYFLFILVQIYQKVVYGKYTLLKMENNNSFTLLKLIKYPLLLIKTIYTCLRQQFLIIWYIILYGAVFGKLLIDSIFSYEVVSFKPFFTLPFIAANLLSFIVLLSFFHFCVWVSHLLIYKYNEKINNIHVFVSLLKLQHKSENRQIHRKCLYLIFNKLKENNCFMDREIRTSKYYKSYWDIFEDYAIQQFQVVFNFHKSLYGKLKQAQIVRKTDKSFLQDLFILDRKVFSIIKTEWNLIRFVNSLDEIRIILSILDKGRERLTANKIHTQLSQQIKLNIKQIANKCEELIGQNYLVCSTSVANALYKYQKTAEKLYEILDSQS